MSGEEGVIDHRVPTAILTPRRSSSTGLKLCLATLTTFDFVLISDRHDSPRPTTTYRTSTTELIHDSIHFCIFLISLLQFP